MSNSNNATFLMMHLWTTKNTQKNNYHTITINCIPFHISEEAKVVVKRYAIFSAAAVGVKTWTLKEPCTWMVRHNLTMKHQMRWTTKNTICWISYRWFCSTSLRCSSTSSSWPSIYLNWSQFWKSVNYFTNKGFLFTYLSPLIMVMVLTLGK